MKHLLDELVWVKSKHESQLTRTRNENSFRSVILASIPSALIVLSAKADVTFQEIYPFQVASQSPYGELTQDTNGDFYGTAKGGGANKDGAVYKINPAGAFTTLFSFNGTNGSAPEGALVKNIDGNFYGTTYSGGTNSSGAKTTYGTIFRITPAGVLNTMFYFENTNGANPAGTLIHDEYGTLYGTTAYGGAYGYGTLFKITLTGVFSNLFSFGNNNGANPAWALAQDSQGDFLGTTVYGGTYGYGTIFKITKDGAFTLLASFNLPNGEAPSAALVQGTNGNFYGTTVAGGANGYGTVYEMTPSGSLTTLYSFSLGVGGIGPVGKLLLASDGNFYGITEEGGANNVGAIFQMTPAGSVTTAFSFNSADGASPLTGLIQGQDGALYGTTTKGGSLNLGAIYKITLSGVFTLLHSFHQVSGLSPRGKLVQGSDGWFYGTTYSGGDYQLGDYLGTVFKVSPSGTFTTLAAFNLTNGALPYDGLVEGSDGDFYGTTYIGGTNSSGAISGNGTVFKMTPDGVVTTLHNFQSADGSKPEAPLIWGSDGNLYGTTDSGGANGYGTVFKMTPAGVLTDLYSFSSDDSNGTHPDSGLTRGNDGNFYGTAFSGGDYGYGTIFKIAPSGTFTKLASFQNSDGAGPLDLVLGRDGNFYGVTTLGGANNLGTVFQVTPSGTLTSLVSFNISNGSTPLGGLVMGGDGNFYGTTSLGGAGLGTVFKITSSGTLTTLVSFLSSLGAGPGTELTLGSDGNLYGTTTESGSRNGGNIFRILPNPSMPFPSPTLQSEVEAGGSLVSTLSGLTNWNIAVLQSSTNLRDWVSIRTNVVSGATLSFTNSINDTIPEKFQRVIVH